MKPQINYIFRKHLPFYHSIEELFATIEKYVKNEMQTDSFELPSSGASVFSILQNLRFIKRNNSHVYHITGDVNYMGIKLGSRALLTIHDIQSALTGNWLKRQLKIWFWFKWPCKRVKFITVISEFSKAELLQLIPKQKDKIEVIYNALNNRIQPDLKKDFNNKQPLVLLMGTKPNKNLERSLQALANIPCKLIIVGPISVYQKKLLAHYKLHYDSHGKLNFDEIIELYRNCDIVCFPSTYEGFGMPIIEAQGVGRPVLTSNIGAMKEVAGNGAVLVDPYCVEAIREGLLKIIMDMNFREDLIQKGLNNVERFKLDVIADKYLELYKKM